jgi:hypothetical protein
MLFNVNQMGFQMRILRPSGLLMNVMKASSTGIG